jgi:tetratricopeptide (TPR) repeat protein
MRQGNFTLAHTTLAEALAVFRQIGDRISIAACLHNLGLVMESQREFEAAHAHYQESWQIRQKVSDKAGVAMSLVSIGSLYIREGKYELAYTYHQDSLQLRRALGIPRDIAETLNYIGIELFEMGNISTAKQHQKESLVFSRAVGALDIEAITLAELALICQRLGEPYHQHLYKACEIAQRINIHLTLVFCQSKFGAPSGSVVYKHRAVPMNRRRVFNTCPPKSELLLGQRPMQPPLNAAKH